MSGCSIWRSDAAALAPAGHLRAVINSGNSLLLPLGSGDAPSGLPVDLAQWLAAWIGVALELVFVTGAGTAYDFLRAGMADVGFLGIAPDRLAGIAFTAPYIDMEATFLVRRGVLRACAQIDAPGRSVVVIERSAPALLLASMLRHARLVTVASLPDAVASLLDGEVTAVAGLRHALALIAKSHSSLDILPDRFALVGQAICAPAARDAALAVAARYLARVTGRSDVTQGPAIPAPS